MTAIFEFLFKYRPLLYERGTITFHPLWPWYVTGILIILALAASYWLYRRSDLSRPWRLGLAGLRAAAFLIILFLLQQPVLRLKSVIPQKNFVAVVYDLSRSMEIRDGRGGQSRIEAVRHLLRPSGNPLLDELASKFKLRFFRFSKAAERTEAFTDTLRHGQITDLERALEQITAEMATAPVAGIVLVTDGADNRSMNLDRTAAQLRARNIPVYAVGIGSPSFPNDAEILRVTAPRKVLRNTVMEAEVLVRSKGYAGRRARLLVLDGERPLQTQEITLGSDDEVKTYKTHFSSQTVGSKVFTFRLDPLPGELIPENNAQAAVVRIEDEQPKILYIEGEPRWEYGFLRRAIEQDKNLRLVTLLRQADGKFLRQGIDAPSVLEKGFPVDKAELYSYKAIVLGSVEASFFTFDQLRMIADFVGQRGGGFLALGGKHSYVQGGYANTPLQDIIPLEFRPGAGGAQEFKETEFKLRLTSYGYEHPITRVSLSQEENRKRWEAAPALAGFNPTAGPKPGATVLAYGSAPDEPGQSPVILAFQRFGRGKSVAFTTATSWRWRMGLAHSDYFHELFWKQMLRWVAGDAPDPVSTEAERNTYSTDDVAVIRSEVNDASFLPLNNAQLTAQVRSPSGQISSIQFVWDVDRDGVYSATFKPSEEGVHEISVEAFQNSRSLGKAKSSFRVAQSTEEFHNAAMNSGLLRRLSDQTGGRYYSLDNVSSLPEDISYIDKGSSRIEEKDLWDMPFLFFLLVGLLSTEWILRKRKRLA